MRPGRHLAAILYATLALALPVDAAVPPATWTQLQTTGGPPTPRVNAYLATDTCRGSAVLYGMPGNQIVPLPKETDYTWVLK
jgi:hypothetical protein